MSLVYTLPLSYLVPVCCLGSSAPTWYTDPQLKSTELQGLFLDGLRVGERGGDRH